MKYGWEAELFYYNMAVNQWATKYELMRKYENTKGIGDYSCAWRW